MRKRGKIGVALLAISASILLSACSFSFSLGGGVGGTGRAPSAGAGRSARLSDAVRRQSACEGCTPGVSGWSVRKSFVELFVSW